MKKTYLAPETEIMNIQNVGMIALSKGSGYADDSDPLVKEYNSGSVDIWGNDEEDEFYPKSIFK